MLLTGKVKWVERSIDRHASSHAEYLESCLSTSHQTIPLDSWPSDNWETKY